LIRIDVAKTVSFAGLVKINDVPALSVVLIGEVLYRPRAEYPKLL
jgi:hypothetical protein